MVSGGATFIGNVYADVLWESSPFSNLLLPINSNFMRLFQLLMNAPEVWGGGTQKMVSIYAISYAGRIANFFSGYSVIFSV